MTNRTCSTVSIALLAFLSVAAKANPISFDFTGTVTVASGIYSSISLGAVVTGTYTFNFANANPAQSSGVVGSPTSDWTSLSFGGPYYFGSPPSVDTVVFSSTATVGGFTYASFSPEPYLTVSRVLASGAPWSGYYAAEEIVCNGSDASCHASNLIGNDLSGISYTSEGLPDFPATPYWQGQFQTGALFGSIPDYVRFSIDSLTPATAVPEPTVLALFGLGMAGLCVNRRRRKH